MTLKQIRTYNIQTHRDVVINLPESGLIRFSGENSNGKSVIAKALNAIVSHSITQPASRRSLITFGQQFGEVTLTRYDGVVLFYHIHLEAAQTFAELRIPNQQTIRRYLADRSIPLLREKFGLHYDDVSSRSLNVSDADDALLFYKTPYKTNASLLKSATTDEKAERSLEKMIEFYKGVRTAYNGLSKNYEVTCATVKAIKVYNIQEEEKRQKKAERYANILRHLEPLGELPTMPEVPDRIISLKPLSLPKIAYPSIININLNIDDRELVKLGDDINKILEGECPLCQRKFFS